LLDALGVPMFTKPANGGSSVGISKVRSGEELERTGPVKDDDLYEALAEDGINRGDAAKLISTLMRDGTIFSPRPGTYRRAS
jgi:D-alanine-D-alanine ligase-like ATP-grasp enzyme